MEDEDIQALKGGRGEVSAHFDALTGAATAPTNQPSYQRKYNKQTMKMIRLPPTIVKVIDSDRRAGLTLLEVSLEKIYSLSRCNACVCKC